MPDTAPAPPADLTVNAVRAFVPARDFALSQRFYAALGFESVWSNAEFAFLRHGDAAFLLQNFHVAEHSANFMMQLAVRDVDAWWAHLNGRGVAQTFGVRIDAPVTQPWGQREIVLFDPSGVLWRIAQPLAAAS
ncbi:MAG TPA: VOC family protein [Burkholderiaceae bacterium]|nr:VOC family protein [Burkholderiaceae bacterium]